MKNLIDELHELDNYEYKVSEDFSKNVMKRIKKEKNKFNYAISIASIGIVACFALILVTNSNFKSSIFDFAKETADNNMKASVDNNRAYYDLIESINDESDKTFSDNINDNYFEIQADSAIAEDIQYSSELKAPNASALNTVNGAIGENITEEKDTANKLGAEGILREDKEFNEIVKILKNADLNVEIEDNELKVKSTKENIENLLKDYENIEIIEEGKYVIIKEK